MSKVFNMKDYRGTKTASKLRMPEVVKRAVAYIKQYQAQALLAAQNASSNEKAMAAIVTAEAADACAKLVLHAFDTINERPSA
jgi:hypothetical protein